jgi:hypothetical protein
VTDYRVCDGPDCDAKAKLESDLRREFGELNPDTFITLERIGGTTEKFHFCSWPCQKKWSAEMKL